MADDSNINYFFIPETNPSVIGVNALDTIMSLVGQVSKITLGTGIINVFSRTQEEICKLSEEIYLKTNRKLNSMNHRIYLFVIISMIVMYMVLKE